MKTRLVAALLALLLMLGLAACGDTQVASVLEQAAEEAGAALGERDEGRMPRWRSPSVSRISPKRRMPF